MRTAILGAVAAVGVSAGAAPAQYVYGGYSPYAPVVVRPVVVAPAPVVSVGFGFGSGFGFGGAYNSGYYRPAYGYGYPAYGYGGYRPAYGGYGYGGYPHYGHHHYGR